MYRDESDKPEMIVALSRFEALCGFAPVDDSVEFLKSMGWRKDAQFLSSRGISEYLRWALEEPARRSFRRAPAWLKRLRKLHKGDPALRVAPLLNHVILERGQALSLPAGNLHAYLHGFGLEVMNSSDNVIRAGFTNKHVDVHELLRIVDTSTLENPVVEMSTDGTFPSPSPSFTVGNSATINRHPDCHRVVYGHLGDWDHSGFSIRHPEVVLVEAGTSAELSGASLIVCTQH
jgi:mannose-6-phosphate isomerase